MLLYVIIFLLAATVCVLSVKIILMKRSADEIKNGIEESLAEDTNVLLSLSSGDRHMRSLAAALNSQLALLRKRRLEYACGNTEIKRAAANISHDLRTPLTAISGYLELLRKEEMSEKARGFLAVIENRTQNMRGLVEELFDYSLATSPEKELSKEPVNISELLLQCLADNYIALSKAGIQPAIDIDDNITRAADEAALKRVFDNILSNAAKYSDGDLLIEASANGTVRFVNHAGALTNVQAGRLFDRFYTVNEASRSTGLGLSIAKLLAERMGGGIDAEYEDGVLALTVKI